MRNKRGPELTPDPLPSAELHNLLQEFRPKLAALLPGSIPSSISSLIVPSQDGQRFDDRTQPGVRVDWILNVGGWNIAVILTFSVHFAILNTQHCQGQGVCPLVLIWC